MNGKTLLLALTLLAVLVAVFFFLPRVGRGVASEADSDLEREEIESREAGVVAEEGGAPEVNALPGNARKTIRPGESDLEKTGREAARERLRDMLRRDDEGLEIVTMPDGHQSIDLKGRFHHVTRLVKAEDGTLVPVCGSHMPEEVGDE